MRELRGKVEGIFRGERFMWARARALAQLGQSARDADRMQLALSLIARPSGAGAKKPAIRRKHRGANPHPT